MTEEEMNNYFNDQYGCSYKRLEELFEFEMDRQMKLSDKLEQLQNNWNELKKWLEDDFYWAYYEEDMSSGRVVEIMKEKMQELENRRV